MENFKKTLGEKEKNQEKKGRTISLTLLIINLLNLSGIFLIILFSSGIKTEAFLMLKELWKISRPPTISLIFFSIQTSTYLIALSGMGAFLLLKEFLIKKKTLALVINIFAYFLILLFLWLYIWNFWEFITYVIKIMPNPEVIFDLLKKF